MKTSFVSRFAGIFFALILTTGFAFSGNDYTGGGRNNTTNATCVNRISGLTQEQKDQITNLRNSHQSVMNDLREKRRSTTDLAQKDQIRKEMDTVVANHRNAVRGLLNADQQKQYDQLARNGSGQQYGNGQGKQWRGSGSGNCSGCGRGYGRNRN